MASTIMFLTTLLYAVKLFYHQTYKDYIDRIILLQHVLPKKDIIKTTYKCFQSKVIKWAADKMLHDLGERPWYELSKTKTPFKQCLADVVFAERLLEFF